MHGDFIGIFIFSFTVFLGFEFLTLARDTFKYSDGSGWLDSTKEFSNEYKRIKIINRDC